MSLFLELPLACSAASVPSSPCGRGSLSVLNVPLTARFQRRFWCRERWSRERWSSFGSSVFCQFSTEWGRGGRNTFRLDGGCSRVLTVWTGWRMFSKSSCAEACRLSLRSNVLHCCTSLCERKVVKKCILGAVLNLVDSLPCIKSSFLVAVFWWLQASILVSDVGKSGVEMLI